jgi:hypothetical protein
MKFVSSKLRDRAFNEIIEGFGCCQFAGVFAFYWKKLNWGAARSKKL